VPVARTCRGVRRTGIVLFTPVVGTSCRKTGNDFLPDVREAKSPSVHSRAWRRRSDLLAEHGLAVTVHTPDVQAASLAGMLGRDEPFRAAAMRLRPYVQGSTPRLRQVSMTLRPAA
jgi:hypothetical protein